MKELELVPWYDYVRCKAINPPAVGDWVVNPDDYKKKSEVIAIRNGYAIVEQEDGVAADYIPIFLKNCMPLNYDNKQPQLAHLVKILQDVDYKNMPAPVVASALIDAGIKIK